jgi:hypothetical protein
MFSVSACVSVSVFVSVSASVSASVSVSVEMQYAFIPARYKDVYLTYLLNELAGLHAIVFLSTCQNAQRLTLMLQNLGFSVTCLHGQMEQVCVLLSSQLVCAAPGLTAVRRVTCPVKAPRCPEQIQDWCQANPARN